MQFQYVFIQNYQMIKYVIIVLTVFLFRFPMLNPIQMWILLKTTSGEPVLLTNIP
jgi:hypothetical protein